MLDVVGLHFNYPLQDVLTDVTFSVAPGTLLHLKGPNGSGKTTLLKLLAGMRNPEKGEIRFQGQNLHYVGHKLGIHNMLSIAENCEFIFGQKPTALYKELLERLVLQNLDDIPCSQLSAGQRRKVALLRLLLSDAPLWLLDEPLITLDQTTLQFFFGCLKQHLANGGCVVLTSHQDLSDFNQYQEYHL